jgi:hypothetical protein
MASNLETTKMATVGGRCVSPRSRPPEGGRRSVITGCSVGAHNPNFHFEPLSSSVAVIVHAKFSKIHGERQGVGDQVSGSAIVDVASRMFSGPPFGGQTPAA